MKQVMAGMVTQAPLKSLIQALLLISLSFPPLSSAYRPGDIVAMSKMGQYHSSRTTWHDVIGKHCPIFAVNREVLIPIAKPVGYTGTDPYKIKFQVGSEKYLIHWLLVINRKSSEVPMIDVNLRYSGGDLLGVTAQVVDMPLSYLNTHPEIRKQFWDPQHWPKHVLVRYTWHATFLDHFQLCFTSLLPLLNKILDTVESRYLAKTLYCDACRKEQSEIDVSSGFYVLFGSALTFSFVLSIYVLQSSREKLARFVRETVVESSSNVGEFGKVE